MTDKVQKIREEVEKLHGNPYYMMAVKDVIAIIDSLQEEPIAPKVLEDMLNAKSAAESLGISQEEHDRIVDELIYGKEPELVDVDDLPNKEEEPVSEVYTFKSIPRLLDMIQPSDRAKTYIAKLADSLDEQGYHTDAKIVRESIKIMDGEKVAMATMDEELVGEKIEVSYDAKINEAHRLGREEGMLLAKTMFKEPVSEDLEEAMQHNAPDNIGIDDLLYWRNGFKVGSQWQKKQMTKKAINAIIEADLDSHGADYGIQKIECTFGELEAKKFKNGARVKLVIVKED